MSITVTISDKIVEQMRGHLQKFGFSNIADDELEAVLRRIALRSFEESSWLTAEIRQLRSSPKSYRGES